MGGSTVVATSVQISLSASLQCIYTVQNYNTSTCETDYTL